MFKVGDKIVAIKYLEGAGFGDVIKKNEEVTISFIYPDGVLLFNEKNIYKRDVVYGWYPQFFRKVTSIKSVIKELVENFVEVEERIDVEQPVEV